MIEWTNITAQFTLKHVQHDLAWSDHAIKQRSGDALIYNSESIKYLLHYLKASLALNWLVNALVMILLGTPNVINIFPLTYSFIIVKIIKLTTYSTSKIPSCSFSHGAAKRSWIHCHCYKRHSIYIWIKSVCLRSYFSQEWMWKRS